MAASADGRTVLLMQNDGNLVECAAVNRAVWATGTRRGGAVARVQSDGNVVVIAPGNVAVWATGTSGNKDRGHQLMRSAGWGDDQWNCLDSLDSPETQIKWGLSYIRGRYGSPSQAWRTFQVQGYY